MIFLQQRNILRDSMATIDSPEDRAAQGDASKLAMQQYAIASNTGALAGRKLVLNTDEKTLEFRKLGIFEKFARIFKCGPASDAEVSMFCITNGISSKEYVNKVSSSLKKSLIKTRLVEYENARMASFVIPALKTIAQASSEEGKIFALAALAQFNPTPDELTEALQHLRDREPEVVSAVDLNEFAGLAKQNMQKIKDQFPQWAKDYTDIEVNQFVEALQVSARKQLPS